MLRFDGRLPVRYTEELMGYMVIIILIKILVFYAFRIYKSMWRYASIDEMIQVVGATIAANMAVLIYMFLVKSSLPRSIYIMVPIIDMAFIGGSRFFYRALQRVKLGPFNVKEAHKRILIVGAGAAGSMVIKEFRSHGHLHSRPVGLIDDDPNKLGKSINGVPVLGSRKDIQSIAMRENVDEIIIAIPSASKKDIGEIVNEAKKTKCKIRILPGVYELIDGKISVSRIRDVEIEDLLGREPVDLDMDEICKYIKGKTVLVTGGGGSIGSELCRQVARFEPKKLVILDIYENNAYNIQNELLRNYKNLSLKVLIASVRDKERMNEIFEAERIDVVFHAAAHKHVPLMEGNPEEAVKNNIFGTLNVVQAADKYGVSKFVFISTDKAVNPTNVMGATKRVSELIIQSANQSSKTDYVAVRFGNVLGSNGSVIPLFKKQISQGGPVTLTHKDVIRYFMTIPEACQLVLQAGGMNGAGEIFILDMGEPVKIIDLAKDLIRLSGFEPDVEIPIEVVGLRPGEKLYEELLLDKEKATTTSHDKIFIEEPVSYNYQALYEKLENLKEDIGSMPKAEIKNQLSEIVPTYKPYKDDTSSD